MSDFARPRLDINQTGREGRGPLAGRALTEYMTQIASRSLGRPMENVVLIIHLILALALIGVVLLQRSEGGGLGMGGGGGGGGLVSSRSAATALGKVTWGLAIAFICTSITLTIIAAQNSAGSSVLDRLGIDAPSGDTPLLPSGDALLPPVPGDTGGGLDLPRAE